MKTSKRIFIKKVKSKKNDTYPMYLRIIHRGVKSEGLISEIDYVKDKHLKDWNVKYERFDTSLLEVNDIISQINIKYRETMVIERGNLDRLSSSQLVEIILNRKIIVKEEKLITIYENYLKEDIISNKNIVEGTKKNHRKSFNHFRNFLIEKNITDISLPDFYGSPANNFKSYLLSKMSDVSAHSILKNVKPFFERKEEEDIIKRSPFHKISIKFRHKEQPRIYNEHFVKLCRLNNPNFKTLELYSDIFQFLCYTGLTYKDLYHIKRSHLSIIDNNIKLNNKRVKTDIKFQQFLIKQASAILDKYKEYPDVIIGDYLLPKKSLSEINKQLKTIGVLSGLNSPLSTYYARRFFRQSLSKAGIQNEVEIKTLMGHSTFGIIDAHYYEIDNDGLQKIKNKLESYFKEILETKN